MRANQNSDSAPVLKTLEEVLKNERIVNGRMASFQNLSRFNHNADDPVGLAKTKWKDGRCRLTEQPAERTHSRLRQARREAARTGSEPNRRGACVGLAERSERSQPHARASAA